MKKDKFNKMVKAICDYMEEKGWQILVIGSSRVQQEINALKYNFELVFRFTGKKIEKKVNKKLK